ncbi:MAG: 3',5'-cyclic-nucleotide phosphodiesterase [Myxococcales bacterium]|nr:3',5'-cyclic-nucleotide phosphodiesterase [Myxococcales bacterium]MBL8721730.1 3',5'-cyclic-nucleotide phosphodiesterase [Myxococcales bacterium]
MNLTVVGCHGGETPKHRTSGFVLRAGGRALAIDAGCLTSGLTLKEQCSLDAVLVSHGHMDHLKDLATLADNRCQNNCPPLEIVSIKQTIDILKKHFFNGLLWPDFTKIPSARHPTITYRTLRKEQTTEVAGFEVKAIMVSHTIDACAFVVRGKGGVLAYSGDTGPTERLWEVLNDTPDLSLMLMEISFPNEQQKLATASGHHTPQTLGPELLKLDRHREVPMLLYHIKPTFERVVSRELTKIKNGTDLQILRIGDEFKL